ncbi:PilW family protein [Herbaspirillum sp. YR522]|uniref:PilW family protein n=1 Tax=Herbaspirillum sp. YR522 TaxID=1144342 RepID=UPI00026F7F0B|nr:PilW family protein [Herbaspirillum sp. YR522]EJN10044.1 prepilin-type N-terminal cleavage/methylation domain-containing protein [Herbaspirillum sp. YR522]
MRHSTAGGFTLIEMMIALAAGLLVVLSASALLHTARTVYLELDDSASIQETGRMSLAHLRTVLSQANHLPWETALRFSDNRVLRGGGLRGLDNRRNGTALDPLDNRFNAGAEPGINQSDILVIGFFGTPGAGQVNSCNSGALGSERDDGIAGSAGRRTWVIYYVRQAGSAEPTLHCRFRNTGADWRSDAIAPGVESMQVLYGVDSDTTAGADRWLNASQMDATLWPRVRLVRIALLVRGRHFSARDGATPAFELLGPGAQAVRIATDQAPRRMRAVFETTVMLRNAVLGAPA